MVTLFSKFNKVGIIAPCKCGSSSLQRKGLDSTSLRFGWNQGPEQRAFVRKSFTELIPKDQLTEIQWYVLTRNPIHWYMSGRKMVTSTTATDLFEENYRYKSLYDHFSYVSDFTKEHVAPSMTYNSDLYKNNVITHCILSPYIIKKSIRETVRPVVSLDIENSTKRVLISKLIKAPFPHKGQSKGPRERICDDTADILRELCADWAALEGFDIEKSLEQWNINT